MCLGHMGARRERERERERGGGREGERACTEEKTSGFVKEKRGTCIGRQDGSAQASTHLLCCSVGGVLTSTCVCASLQNRPTAIQMYEELINLNGMPDPSIDASPIR
jgi:hypothetical protein